MQRDGWVMRLKALKNAAAKRHQRDRTARFGNDAQANLRKVTQELAAEVGRHGPRRGDRLRASEKTENAAHTRNVREDQAGVL
jgi:ATP phosphoribosyltransferase regulatory subunit HisZ